MDTDFQRLGRRLVGRWVSEGTHPAFPGAVIAGSAEFEWLTGEQFLVFRSRYDHADIPDAISILGVVDGLHMYYFDSRGVHRVYELTLLEDGWRISMDRAADTNAFASPDAPFSQRVTYALAPGDGEMSAKGELAHDGVTWNDDLALTYRRTSPRVRPLCRN